MKGTQFTPQVLARTLMRLLIAKTMVGVTPTISSGGGSQTVVIFRGTCCFGFIRFVIPVQSFVCVVLFFCFMVRCLCSSSIYCHRITDDDLEVKFGNKQSMAETYYVYNLYNFIGGNSFLNT
jgi:hypothetical protein